MTTSAKFLDVYESEVAPPLGDQLRKATSTWARSQYLIVTLAAEFADTAEWVLDGSPTASHWLADVADIELSTAREWIRIGRLLHDLPAVDEAFADGFLSYSKTRALTRVASSENESELLIIALRTPAGHLARELAAWINRNSDPNDLAQRQHLQRSIKWRTDPDGMTTFTLRLPPLLAGLLISILTTLVMRASAYRGQNAPADAWPTLAQQHADALGHLIATGPGTVTTEVVIHVRGDGCTLDDGTPIPHSAVERIAPASFVRALVHNIDGHPIDATNRRRHPTTRQKRVVKDRDGACVDCGRHALLEYDHVPPYELSGHTITGELALRCAPCHQNRHRNETNSRTDRVMG